MTKLRLFLFLLTLSSAVLWAQAPNPPQPAAQDSEAPAPLPPPPAPSGVLADSTAVEIVHAERAAFPLDASEKGIQGEVIVKVYIAENGDVVKTEVISGNPILAESAVDAAKKFKFKPFIRNGKPLPISTRLPFDFYFRDKTNVLSEKEIDAEMAKRSQTSETPTKPIPGSSDAPKRIRVSQGVSQGLLIRKVAPVYPQEAKFYGIQGTVVLQAIIGTDGRIKNLKAISGPKDLIQPSIDAVQMWVYRPYLLFGNPVEVDTQITVNFQLGG